MDDARMREALVAEMQRQGSLQSAAVARAFLRVPRHRFIPDTPLDEAYADRAISIKTDRRETLASISQPSMLARMLELAAVEPGNRVLEVGTGSGYNAALLAELAGSAGRVVSVEVEDDLAARARATLEAWGYGAVRIVRGDGYAGCPDFAPYDRIVVSARAYDVPAAWWDQLVEGGRLVVPLDVGVGGEYAVGFVRRGEELCSVGTVHCLFLPLRGEERAGTERVFVRSKGARYSLRPREIASVVAVKTRQAQPELLGRADVVVAQPQTTFAISWEAESADNR
jgi:protein-L-isoaspartate(D-aspartate) O-methyltransferase